uniref:Large ribosomal subunit protein uL4c n=1 Tax=Periphykon beckeri TaxID=2006982 RepID=A0A1Z1M3E3_9FLOR|nr:ribosomal protein L4 [Periphykon beckeri]ARW60442.1 ribosomal protein L4 [Periphykon beckeri]
MSTNQKFTYKLQPINSINYSKDIKLKIHNEREAQMYLIHKAVKNQLKNNRIRNAHTKTRSEVRGGGKKPWKQKGTGRARAGSNRSPLWKGGGVIFGPRRRIYKSKINKKEKRLAISTVFANKFNNTFIVNEILNNVNTPNTKAAIAEIKKFGIQIQEKQKFLLVVSKKTRTLHLSFRNIYNVELIEVQSINILSLLKADIIIITRTALDHIN